MKPRWQQKTWWSSLGGVFSGLAMIGFSCWRLFTLKLEPSEFTALQGVMIGGIGLMFSSLGSVFAREGAVSDAARMDEERG